MDIRISGHQGGEYRRIRSSGGRISEYQGIRRLPVFWTWYPDLL